MRRRNLTLTIVLYTCIVCNMFGVLNLADASDDTVIEVTDDKADADEVVRKMNIQASEFDRYVKLFEHQRAIQIDAVKNLQKSNMKHEQKHTLTEMMVKDLFKVIEQAKDNLTEWGYVPGDPMPDNNTVKDSISKVFENTAIFGDLILRLPDLTHSIYDKNKQWEFLIGWAVWFSMESGVFKGPHQTLLSLMSMEIGLIPKDDTFVNPYKGFDDLEAFDGKSTEDINKERKERKKKEHAEKIKKKSAETKAKRKGPRLSGSHTEL